MRTVGVTGTNGKTTTTTWVAATLARVVRPVALVTTIGLSLDDEAVTDLPPSHLGFLQLMKRAEERGGGFAAVEYTSEALAHGYSRRWPAEIAVFTNLTHDHLDAHGSAEHYLASKAQLFMTLPEGGVAVLNAGDPSSALLEEVIAPGRRVLRYSVPSRGDASAHLRATKVELSWSGTRVSVDLAELRAEPARENKASSRVLEIRAIGEVFAENALAALGAAIAAGVPIDEAIDALGHASAPPGRFQVIAERPWIVVDYAHSPDALSRTLASARRLCGATLHVVFGAGGDRDREKRRPMGEAASIADRVVLTTDNARGEDPAAIAASIRAGIHDGRDPHAKVETILDRARAIETTVKSAAVDDVIVIAGKGHERTQTARGKVVPFDDAVAARAAWDARG